MWSLVCFLLPSIGYTAFHEAAQKANHTAVSILLKLLRDREAKDPAQVARPQEQKSPELQRDPAESETLALLFRPDHDGMTPLQTLVRTAHNEGQEHVIVFKQHFCIDPP